MALTDLAANASRMKGADLEEAMNTSDIFEHDPNQGYTLERLIRQIVQDELQRLANQHSDARPVLREAPELIYQTKPESSQQVLVGAYNYEEEMEHELKAKVQYLGRWIVANPSICHGKPTFRNTRIMVWQVLEMVASGMAWETIVEQWDGKVTMDAIAEAVQLANRSFLLHAHEHSFESVPA